MITIRPVRERFQGRPTVEGAGVHLHRAFGFGREHLFDPFLLLDDFRGDDPELYSAGFPWHPHRGIETITYLIEGDVEHGDSMGNEGRIGPGDVQWMTAGSGVIHQEMPHGDPAGRMGGFQLWANLPASHKMIDPRYCGIQSEDIPVVETAEACVRVVCGRVAEVSGPVTDIVIEPEYLDVTVTADNTWTHPTTRGHTVFAYLFEGEACFGPQEAAVCAEDGVVVLFGDGDEVSVTGGPDGARLLLVSGKPLGEPIAWGGPIVMNSREELERAFEEYRAGTFVKHDARGR
jgi:redox-sensitive bicupin YhaK (pirin superfamily)